MSAPTASRRALLAAVLATTAALAGSAGCRSIERDGGPFRKVRPPVAFEMLHDSPDLPVVDLRTAEAFHGPLGHLEGARNLPLADLPGRHGEILELQDITFLVYCHENECDPAAMDFFRQHGFEDVMLIDGGIAAWVDGGFETVGAGAPAEHRDEDEADDRGEGGG